MGRTARSPAILGGFEAAEGAPLEAGGGEATGGEGTRGRGSGGDWGLGIGRLEEEGNLEGGMGVGRRLCAGAEGLTVMGTLPAEGGRENVGGSGVAGAVAGANPGARTAGKLPDCPLGTAEIPRTLIVLSAGATAGPPDSSGSRTSMMFWHALQRICRILPRTFSSVMW